MFSTVVCSVSVCQPRSSVDVLNSSNCESPRMVLQLPQSPLFRDWVSSRQNRFECLTCPYHLVIDKAKYFERKNIKKKEVEDILGGKGAWDNVDKTQGMFEMLDDVSWGRVSELM